MKKLYIAVSAVFILGAFSNAQVSMTSISPENVTLRSSLNDDFTKSNDFRTITENVKQFGEVSFNDVKLVQRTMEGEAVNVLNYKVLKNSNTVGYLQVIKDANGVFYSQFIDFAAFNLQTSEGTLTFLDVKTQQKIMTLTVRGGRIVNTVLNNPNYTNGSTQTTSGRKNPFDTNGNGDVSFFECYSVANNAIDQDGFSSWVCDFPVIGWLSCWGTVSTACAIYSAGH
ncbi:hypothetical protein ASG31_16190 [Chryseobacterium sp. Leaf404]|uniref:hypothetical protein n=1 Tax=unclassified Chryseobacterium TaxID=2593645 RepID=UPI000700D73F|nr:MULTISPECIES: hypothetical protein [unclassified Chryseobacterium]KQT15135.1 hypothetical protein ASG31_16190 [Chryseobacterium sp. Leaf404]